MKLDISRIVGAVTREIKSTVYNGQAARVLIASRSYNTTTEDLWDALTNPERIRRWFFPVSGDLRLGGRYQIEGNASGEITACEPPRHLALTWGMQGQVSWVKIRLQEAQVKTSVLELEHIAHVPDELWNQFGPGAVGIGWDQTLMGLELHLVQKHQAVDPQAVTAWQASDEGKDFVYKASDAWAEASIATGTEATAAREAAKRTAAFYTGAGM